MQLPREIISMILKIRWWNARKERLEKILIFLVLKRVPDKIRERPVDYSVWLKHRGKELYFCCQETSYEFIKRFYEEIDGYIKSRFSYSLIKQGNGTKYQFRRLGQ